MAKSKLKDEILVATELDEDIFDSDQELYGALTNKASRLDDEDWDKLSSDAQDWINNAADALNGKKDIEGFPDAQDNDPDPKPARRRRGKTTDKKEDGGDDKKDDKPARRRHGKTTDKKEDGGDDKKEDGGDDKKDDKPARRRRGKTTDKKEDGGDDKKDAVRKPRGRRPGGSSDKPTAGFRAKVLIIEADGEITNEEVLEALSKEGLKFSVVSLNVVRSELEMTLKILEEQGKLAS